MSQAIHIAIIGSDAASLDKLTKYAGNQGKNAVVDGVAIGFERGAELINRKKPMVVIADMCSQEVNPCLHWIEAIVTSFPRISIFVIYDDDSYETIRKFMGAGATEYLLNPVSELDLSSALHKFHRLRALPKPGRAEGGKIYSICSSKNGVGVTTIAVNLAASIYEATGEPTIIVDLDLIGGDVATFLHLKPAYTISDLAANIKRADISVLQDAITEHASGIHVLAAPHTMEEGISVSGESIIKMLGHLKAMYEHIIIDTECNLTQATMAAIYMSDVMLLTFILNLPSIKNTRRYLHYLNRDIERSHKIRLVVNRYLKKLEIPVEEAETILERPVFWSIPNDFNTAASCLNKGVTLGACAPRSKLTLAIKDLAMELTDNGKKPE